jgi:hypothetical protein
MCQNSFADSYHFLTGITYDLSTVEHALLSIMLRDAGTKPSSFISEKKKTMLLGRKLVIPSTMSFKFSSP